MVFDSGTDTVDLATLTLPANTLDFGTTYSWQARYEDNHGAWSEYSTATTFTTADPDIGSSAQAGGNIVFAWPTNTTGFVLQYATNLPSTNWLPVSPLPVMVGGSYVVTNVPGAGNMFFRLFKP